MTVPISLPAGFFQCSPIFTRLYSSSSTLRTLHCRRLLLKHSWYSPPRISLSSLSLRIFQPCPQSLCKSHLQISPNLSALFPSHLSLPTLMQRKLWPQVKAPTTERAPESVRCGKWDLRPTKIQTNRVQDLSPTKKQLTTRTKKRKQHASPTSSANSVVGENNVQVLKMNRSQIVFEKWTYATTQIFIEVMLEEAKKEESTNSKKTRTFNPHKWVAICEKFGKRTNTVCYSIQKLKEKFSRLKHDLSIFKDLKDHSGFGWDPVKQTVTAPEPVWQEYIQGHKDAKRFKSKGLDHYDILVELCEGTLATGAFFGYPSTLGSPTAEDERELMRQGKPIRMVDQISMDSRGKRKSDGTGGSSSKSIKIDEKSQAYATFGYAQQKRGEYYEKLTANQFCISDCIKALDEITSFFDDNQYYKAYDMLAFGPPAGRQGFMGLSTDKRIGWVERIGRQS